MIKEIIEAHGGVERWNRLEAIEAEISVRGLLFTITGVPVLSRVRVRASTREPRFTFLDFPRTGQTGEFIGDEEVRIIDSDKKVLAVRANPRSAFRGLCRAFNWDHLQFLYFGGYATWNYLVTPFLFLREGFAFEELKPVHTASGPWSRLRVSFPPAVPTHCGTQIFYFDQDRLLRRLDYTAEVLGRWAHAAHLCDRYQEFDGLKIPTKRRVRPLFIGDNPLPAPTVVAIDVHAVRIIQEQEG
jgi:hypothetical protein